jgi:hypothetical protein
VTLHGDRMTDRERGLRALSVLLWTIGTGLGVGYLLGPIWGVGGAFVMLGLCQMGAPR